MVGDGTGPTAGWTSVCAWVSLCTAPSTGWCASPAPWVPTAGQVLGLGGSTGRSTGPHLHFEVRFQYEPFDPEWILDFSNYTLRTRKLYLDKTYFGIRKPSKGESLVYKADKSIVPEEPATVRRTNKPVYATMRKGETLDDLARRNYTTAEKLKELNPDVTKFKSGMRLRVR